MLEVTTGWVADELETPLPMLELDAPPPTEELSVQVELETPPPTDELEIALTMLLDEVPPQYVPGIVTVLAWHGAVAVTVERMLLPEIVDVKVLYDVAYTVVVALPPGADAHVVCVVTDVRVEMETLPPAHDVEG